MKNRPWYKRYPADWRAATNHLTIPQQGAYTWLLDEMYMNKQGKIPKDPEWIMRRAHITKDEFEAWFLPVIEEFCSTTRGGHFITQQRVQKELLLLAAQSKRQSKRSGNRWKNKDKEVCVPAMPLDTDTDTDTDTDISLSERESTATAREKEKQVSQNVKLGLRPLGDGLNALPRGPANYADPEVRKQRWQQKMCVFLQQKLEPDQYEHLLSGYIANEDWAIKAWNGYDTQRKAWEKTQH